MKVRMELIANTDILMPEPDILIGQRNLEKFSIIWRIPNGTQLDKVAATLCAERIS